MVTDRAKGDKTEIAPCAPFWPRWRFRFSAPAAIIVAAQASLVGCAPDQRLRVVPSALAADLTFVQVENARFFGEDVAALRVEVERAFARRSAQPHSASPVTFLALSAGQEDGAFGADLLAGRSQHGGRPAFDIVTGTSTGASAAAFAFLGGEYDLALAAMYTRTGIKDIVREKSPMTEIDLVWLLSLLWLANEVVNGALLDVLVCTAGIAVALGLFAAAPSQ